MSKITATFKDADPVTFTDAEGAGPINDSYLAVGLKDKRQVMFNNDVVLGVEIEPDLADKMGV